MPVKKLKKFLDNNDVKYVSISHSPAYSAQAIAESAHIPGKQLAKTVIVRIDDKFAMAVCRLLAEFNWAIWKSPYQHPTLNSRLKPK